MRCEYDLINELGPKNWLDVVAGEAVVEGHRMNEPELVASGTKLAKMIKEVPFYDDGFEKVIAFGASLEKIIKEAKMEFEKIEFLDNLFVGQEKNKSCTDWEYTFIYAQKRYQIMMMLPEYYGVPKRDEIKTAADEAIRNTLIDPEFINCQKTECKMENGTQEFCYSWYCDGQGREVLRIVDFNHEGEIKRGRIETYYFDDQSLAKEAWRGVRDAFISDRRR